MNQAMINHPRGFNNEFTVVVAQTPEEIEKLKAIDFEPISEEELKAKKSAMQELDRTGGVVRMDYYHSVSQFLQTYPNAFTPA